MASENDVSQILAMLAATYPRFNLTKETTLVYFRLLEDIPADMLKAAALQCARTLDFFPSVNEIFQAVYEISARIEGIPAPAEAWYEVTQAKADYRNWSHPLVKKVAYELGWNSYQFPGENLSADRAHFFKSYEKAIHDYFSDQYAMPEVQGFIEASRMSKPLPQVIEQIKILAERMSVK